MRENQERRLGGRIDMQRRRTGRRFKARSWSVEPSVSQHRAVKRWRQGLRLEARDATRRDARPSLRVHRQSILFLVGRRAFSIGECNALRDETPTGRQHLPQRQSLFPHRAPLRCLPRMEHSKNKIGEARLRVAANAAFRGRSGR